jgi:hypothetical protein
MQAQVKVWQLIAAVISTIATMLTVVFMFTNRMEAAAKTTENHEIRIGSLEKQNNEFRQEYKMDIRELKDGQQEILILLQNKQDRK